MNPSQYDQAIWRLLRSENPEIVTECLLVCGMPPDNINMATEPVWDLHSASWEVWRHSVDRWLYERYHWQGSTARKRAGDLLSHALRDLQPL